MIGLFLHVLQLPKGMDCTQWADPSRSSSQESCPEPVPGMVMEEYNSYALVMDIDGRGWSARLSSLMSSNTPIVKHVRVGSILTWSVPQYVGCSSRMITHMKSCFCFETKLTLSQASQFLDFSTEHLLKDQPVEFFKSDLSDFVNVVRESHFKQKRSPVEYHEAMVRKMQKFARTHFTHFGIARDMAYGLTIYASKMAWVPEIGKNFTQVPMDYFMIETLPEEFLEKLHLQFQ